VTDDEFDAWWAGLSAAERRMVCDARNRPFSYVHPVHALIERTGYAMVRIPKRGSPDQCVMPAELKQHLAEGHSCSGAQLYGE
jgi:hypothetical protein